LIQLVSSVQIQSDILDLLKDHFSTGRRIEGMSQSSLKFDKENENAGTLKIRPSVIVTQNDISEDIPIIAVSYDRATDQVLGFNQGEMSYDENTGTSTRAFLRRVPIYVNAIASNDVQSGLLADYVCDMLIILRQVLLEIDWYFEALFQSPGNPTIIRYVGPGNMTYATPIAGYVEVIRMYEITEKAETMTGMSAQIDGQEIWNGGPSDD
jgi:hypothetical protein